MVFRRSGGGRWTVTGWILVLGLLLPAGSGAAERRNVVLISLDTTRADHLGCYGGSAATPALDSLAARGVRFARCDTAVPVTLPSHATILTGLLPPRHRVRDNGTFRLDDRYTTVAESFAAAGWDTAAAVAAVVLDRRYGLAQGFRLYDDRLGERESRRGEAVTDAALAMLPRLRRPFFLWVHYYDPHEPYDPPSDLVQGTGRTARYDGELAAMDRAVGRLLRALPPGTIVVAVGDHGEMLGDHGEATHGVLLEHGARRVPLLVAGPGVSAGRVVEPLVATVDVAPTLLALAGLAVAKDLDGRSLLPAIRGSRTGSELTYCESLLGFYAYRWRPLAALSDGRWLFVDASPPRLYDLRHDPDETRNVAARHEGAVRRWSRKLAELRRQWGEGDAPTPGHVDEAMRRKLASLGYLGGSGTAATGPLLDPYSSVWIVEALLGAGHDVQAGRCGAAKPVLARILRVNRDNVPALNMAGICRMEEGDFDGALALFRRAERVNPLSAIAHADAGGCLLRLGRRDEAEAAYRAALAVDPALPQAAVNLAHLLREKGRTADALAVLDRALEAGSPHPRLLLERGLIRGESGNPAAAYQDLRRGLDLAPDDPDLLENTARAAYELGRFREAVALYRRLAAVRPRDPGPWKTIGAIRLHRLGDARGALEAFRHALKLERSPADRKELEALVQDLSRMSESGTRGRPARTPRTP